MSGGGFDFLMQYRGLSASESYYIESIPVYGQAIANTVELSYLKRTLLHKDDEGRRWSDVLPTDVYNKI